MKIRATPTEIMLKDLPLEGRDFNYTRESGELNQPLKDLIEDRAYKINLHLMPVGNAFSLTGEIDTSLELQCSRCAIEFPYAVKQKVNELIVVEKAMHKGDHQSRANHIHELSDTGPDYLVLENDVFKVGEYVHEQVALAEPIKPLCAPETPEGCAHPEARVQRDWLTYDEDNRQSIKANPFQILEKMKLKD